MGSFFPPVFVFLLVKDNPTTTFGADSFNVDSRVFENSSGLFSLKKNMPPAVLKKNIEEM